MRILRYNRLRSNAANENACWRFSDERIDGAYRSIVEGIFHLHGCSLLFTPRKFRITVWRSDNIVICRRCSNCAPPFTLFLTEHVIFVCQSSRCLGSYPRCPIDNNNCTEMVISFGKKYIYVLYIHIYIYTVD